MVTADTTTATTTNVSMATSTSFPVSAATVETTHSFKAAKPSGYAAFSFETHVSILIGACRQEDTDSLKDSDQGKKSTESSKPESDSTLLPSVTFVPEACLFCPQISPDFNINLKHMQKSHGLFIPTSIDDDALHLAVDMETLVGYMHLVIFGYHECLFCGTQRADGSAARQHMMGKGHCRIDLADSESEWRDFYESDVGLESEDESVGESVVEDEVEPIPQGQHPVNIGAEGKTPREHDGDTIHLSSGKVIASRTAPAPKIRHHKPLTEKNTHTRRGVNHLVLEDFMPTPEQPSTTSYHDSTTNSSSTADAATTQDSSSVPPSQAQTLSRADRRLLAANKSAITSAVATMSTRDRASLAHLSMSEKRAMVVRQFKHQEQTNKAMRKYWSKFERRQDIPAVGGKVYIGGG